MPSNASRFAEAAAHVCPIEAIQALIGLDHHNPEPCSMCGERHTRPTSERLT